MKAKGLIVLVLWAVLTVPQVRAQYGDYYYHRVGDTIEWRSEIGYYDWWEFEEWYENYLMLHINWWGTPPLSDSAVMLQRFYTPAPLKIIGVAGSPCRGHINANPRFEIAGAVDTDSYKEYFLIYDAMPDSFPLMASAEWNPFDPHRTLYLMTHVDGLLLRQDSCCGNEPTDYYIPIYEYYFDSAIYVTDSFYVGGTNFGTHCVPGQAQEDIIKTYYRSANSMIAPWKSCSQELVGSWGDIRCCVPGITVKTKHKELGTATLGGVGFYEAEWKWNTFPPIHSVLIYPIIEVDTTVPPASACDTIANVQVTPAGLSATVTWDGFPNYSGITLRYGKRQVPQSQWTEVDVTGSTLYTLTGLDSISFYGVTLKAECDIGKKETPWSSPVYFYVATDTTGGGTEGADGATLLSRLTFLQPNPAREEVTVTSSFSLNAIEIWTADGVMVYHGKRTGHDATVDVSWLRSGTYIVAIHTHNGTTHKRLLIAR